MKPSLNYANVNGSPRFLEYTNLCTAFYLSAIVNIKYVEFNHNRVIRILIIAIIIILIIIIIIIMILSIIMTIKCINNNNNNNIGKPL